MMEVIAEKTGISGTTHIIHFALAELYRKCAPAYKDNINAIPTENAVKAKARMKVIAKNVEEEMKDEAKNAKKMSICTDVLYGSVEEGEHGKVCRWNTYYNTGKVSSQMVPLKQVNAVLAETSLFIPNRATVLDALPELVVTLGIKE